MTDELNQLSGSQSALLILIAANGGIVHETPDGLLLKNLKDDHGNPLMILDHSSQLALHREAAKYVDQTIKTIQPNRKAVAAAKGTT